MSSDSQRYTNVAVTLHWVMALCFFAMLASGLVMTEDDLLPKDLRYSMFQWHKSLGVLLLIAFFVRIGWKLFHRVPSLPESIKGLEKLAAKAGHYALYFWMFAVPMSGWAVVSSSSYGLPTVVFGWFTWPHIPGLSGNEAIHDLGEEAHELLAYSFMALIAVHIAAVIKHAVIDKHNLLPRMWFGSLLLALLVLPNSVHAAEYAVDYEHSELSFSGTHAGNEFSGVFEDWTAEIAFDPDDLEGSHVHVVIQTKSAKTGDKQYDGALATKDWFNAKKFPEAVFDSTAIDANDDGSYAVSGNLAIKEIVKPISFNFTLTDITQNPVEAEASFSLNRLDYEMGLKSDPGAEWVAEDIVLQLKVSAASKQSTE